MENISCHKDTQSADFTENTFLPLFQQQSIDNMPSDLMTNEPSNLPINEDLNLKTQTGNLVLNVSQSNPNMGTSLFHPSNDYVSRNKNYVDVSESTNGNNIMIQQMTCFLFSNGHLVDKSQICLIIYIRNKMNRLSHIMCRVRMRFLVFWY